MNQNNRRFDAYNKHKAQGQSLEKGEEKARLPEVKPFVPQAISTQPNVKPFVPQKISKQETFEKQFLKTTEKDASSAAAKSQSVGQQPDVGKNSDSLQYALDRQGLIKVPDAIRDNTHRQVAKFLLLIGVEEASNVLKHLSQDQIDKIIPEIASIRHVDKDEAAIILAQFESLTQRVREGGGVDTARTILEKAFGQDMAQTMLEKTVPFPDGKPFDCLQDIDNEHILLLLKDETAQIRALVLSYLKPATAAEVINRMSADDKAATVKQLAKMQPLPKDVVRRIDRTMSEKVQNLESHDNGSVDGRNALAEILRRMDVGSENEILAHLQDSDPDLESDLRERLFTLDDVIKVDNRYLQKVLSNMKNENLAVLIAGKTDQFRKKILTNISTGRSDIVLEEESLRKPISKRDSQTETAFFVQKLRSAWEAGEYKLDDRDEDIWVQ